ncbi:MAG: endolytic transglycosylase MltG, partial [Sporichthyaceae bacterium]|nr:endolytic transglycosylase MltG [Sporichthyaceae bacterium]
GRSEGFLFPATYTIEPDTTAESLLGEMIGTFDQVASDIDLEGRAREVGLTPYQVVVVASIIQAEARHAEDFPKVARVIYNRLDRDMRLQMDSTVHYAVRKSGEVTTTAKDRQSSSRYNTYRYTGLPPGPINAPGEQALEAALSPADGGWLYFVTVNPDTGETKFAETAAEHARYVDELQAWLRDN